MKSVVLLTAISLMFMPRGGIAKCFPSPPTQFQFLFKSLPLAEIISADIARQIQETARRIYEKEFLTQFGAPLIILEVPHYDFNGFAKIGPQGERIIELNIGLRFQPNVTREAYAMVVCHEIGHHLGGAPQIEWSSVEGQADYFATNKCMKRLLPQLALNTVIDHRFVEACKVAKADDPNLCAEVLKSSQDLGNVIGDLAVLSEEDFPNIFSQSLLVVSKTLKSHADPQCRLDTFRSGSLCGASPLTDTYCDSFFNPQFKRPTCWYSEYLPMLF